MQYSAPHATCRLHSTLQSSPHWLVFFSPSGVRAAQTGLQARVNDSRSPAYFNPFAEVRFAALGQTTAAAVRAAGWVKYELLYERQYRS
jgi:uroporphyrinogen-III synthase